MHIAMETGNHSVSWYTVCTTRAAHTVHIQCTVHAHIPPSSELPLDMHINLKQWSDREKQLQLKLRLKGQVFNVLTKELVCDFSTTVDSLRKQVAPIHREALLSAQLFK